MSPSRMDRECASHFSDGQGLATPASVRRFECGPGVVLYTDGRKPGPSTARTVRATVATLFAVYGPCPHPGGVRVVLRENSAPKRFPGTGPVTEGHINSGFSQGDRIVVFRCSEMHRTLVHEFLHVWKSHGPDSPGEQAVATRALSAPHGCLLSESFVEAATWLIYGGFCPRSLDPGAALTTARRYLSVQDDGRTNGWAYFVGKALLVADGGAAFHNVFFSGARRLGRRCSGATAYRELVRVMSRNRDSVPDMSPLPSKGHLPILCGCDLGPAFSGGAA